MFLNDMLLVFLTAPAIFFGISNGLSFPEECYGNNFTIPDSFSPPFYKGPLYFTPSDGGPRKVLMDNGEAKDPRLKISFSSVVLTHLTEKDNGKFGISFGDDNVIDIVLLEVLECADTMNKRYGYEVSYRFDRKAEFLEFTPQHSLDQPMILWNRTDPQISHGGRGRIESNLWIISRATQADNGYYNFRRKDKYLVSRLHLKVEEDNHFYDGKVNTNLRIKNPWTGGEWTVTFKSEKTKKSETVIRDGSMVWRDHTFSGRIQILKRGFDIYPLESTDAGTFEFRDPQGNLALVAHLDIIPVFDGKIGPIAITVATVTFLLGIFCYCFCCKKKCCQKDKPTPQTAAAPKVFYHDPSNPSGTASPAAPVTSHPSSFTNVPVNTTASNNPTHSSLEPLNYQPVNVHVNPPQAEVGKQSQIAAPADTGSTQVPSFGLDVLSSDFEPKFELKGLSFFSAPPLSSDTSSCDVYSSEKLNFL